MPETKKIICKNCNKEFEAPVNSRALFCSDLCKKMYRSDQRKAKRGNSTIGRPKTKSNKTTKTKAKTALEPVNKPLSQEDLLEEIFDPRIWEERPVDIETFLFDRNYLGNSWLDGNNKRTMFPFWQEQAKQMFPLPMKSPYNTIIFSGATGIGKTSVAMGICCAYYLHIVMCLRNPHAYFDLADQKEIVFAIVNIVTKTMAYKNAWGMLHKMLLRSPWFMCRGAKTTGKRPEWYCTTKPISLIYGRGADDLIGLDILFAFLDEISFYRNKSIEAQIGAAKELFNAAWERMKSRYVKFGGIFDGLMCMASSKRTDVSFMENFIKEIMDSQDKDKVLLIDKPRWEILPPESYCGKKFPIAVGDKFRPSQIIKEEEVETFEKAGYKIYWPPIENLGEFERDMAKALTNIAGVSVGQISSFLRGDLVTNCIDENLVNPFTKSIIYSGFKDSDQYWEYFNLGVISQEDYTLPLFVHLDASLGRDGNSISGVLTDYAINQKDVSGNYQPELHYRQLFKIKVRAPQGTETGLDKNTKFIYWLSQRFNLQGVSHDQYQSKQFHQDMERAGIKVVQQSVDAVKDGINPVYAVLKDSMYEKRVTLLNDEDQTTELVTLEKYESGKIDKPQGGTDDAAQCLAGAVYLASQAKEEVLSSGAVLLKQLASSEGREIQANTTPAEVVAKELEKHFSQYSPEAQKVSQESSLRKQWNSFFGKEEDQKPKEVNPTAYWG